MLIRNSSADCVKAIDSDGNYFATTICNEMNYRDPDLRKWKSTIVNDMSQEARHSSYSLILPLALIYRWGYNITILEQTKQIETSCPTYCFLLIATHSFRTFDHLVSHNGGEMSRKASQTIFTQVLRYLDEASVPLAAAMSYPSQDSTCGTLSQIALNFTSVFLSYMTR